MDNLKHHQTKQCSAHERMSLQKALTMKHKHVLEGAKAAHMYLAA